MGLVAGDDHHAPQCGRQRRLVRRELLVVFPRDYLFVIGIGAFDQAGEYLGGGRTESQMVLALGDLDFLLGVEHPPNLFQGLGRHYEIGVFGTPLDRYVHPRQPVAVGGHHPHPFGSQFPQNSVEDRAALFGAGGECHVPDQFLQVLGGTLPAVIKRHRRERRKFLTRKSQEFELGSAALDGDALLAGGTDLDGGTRHLANDLDQLSGRQGYGTLFVHRCRNCGRHGNVQVGAREPKAPLLGFHKDVGKHWKGGFGRNARGNGGQGFLQMFARDCELHSRSLVTLKQERLLVITISSSSSRGSGNVDCRVNSSPHR